MVVIALPATEPAVRWHDLMGSPSASTASSPGTGTPAAAAGASFPVTLTAANGPVTIKAKPLRIVSLAPTATEDLYAVGAGPQVVAVDQDSDYPHGVPVTKLSGLTPNLEAIASYRPDLVAPWEEILPLYREQAELLAPFVDLFICETMSSAAEALR